MSKRDTHKRPDARSERAQRLAQLRRQQSRADLRNRTLIWIAGATGVAVVIGLTAFAMANQAEDQGMDGVLSYPSLKASHVDGPVEYEQTPPAGGPHAPVWLNCGQYQQAVPSENAAHSLEHGAVWVTYRPDASPETIKALESSVNQPYTIFSPFEGLRTPVVASAWGKQLFLDEADDPRLAAFLREYVQGPQAPEAGASCTGGTDGRDSDGPASMEP